MWQKTIESIRPQGAISTTLPHIVDQQELIPNSKHIQQTHLSFYGS
jgi:hypothetical protein